MSAAELLTETLAGTVVFPCKVKLEDMSLPFASTLASLAPFQDRQERTQLPFASSSALLHFNLHLAQLAYKIATMDVNARQKQRNERINLLRQQQELLRKQPEIGELILQEMAAEE